MSELQLENSQEDSAIKSQIAKQHGIGYTIGATVKCCHLCNPEIRLKDIQNPVKMTLNSGIEICFCNEQEMNLWKSTYQNS